MSDRVVAWLALVVGVVLAAVSVTVLVWGLGVVVGAVLAGGAGAWLVQGEIEEAG